MRTTLIEGRKINLLKDERIKKLLEEKVIGAYWSCGLNVGFWIHRLTVLAPASLCCVLEQDTLSALFQSNEL